MRSVLILPAILVSGLTLAACTHTGSSSSATPTPTSAVMVKDETTMLASASPVASETGVMVGGAMMVRDKDIVDNAMMAKNVTTVVAAVKAAGLVDTLKGTGPFTVFAPTNAAFDKLPAGTVNTLLMPENKAKLSTILTYHVVPGRYTAATLKDGQQLKTVQGQALTVSKSGSAWMIKDAMGNTAKVETADVISSNGVTFVIDSVLMPKM